MTVNVEILEKLERKFPVTLPKAEVQKEIEVRLRRLSKQVKMQGFRPGKVPMSVVAQQYGYSVEQEVLQEKLGQEFFKLATEADLRVAGAPSFTQKTEGVEDTQMVFDAVFEIYPEVKLPDIAGLEIERISAEVDDAAIERTVDILRSQRATHKEYPADHAAIEGDRLTVDFEGKIDGEPFAGGKATDFVFSLGENTMLKEFEDAVKGMKVGQTKTFQLTFPEDYHGKDVAGKLADFLITLKKIEEQILPEVNDELAKELGVADGTVEALKKDIKTNLEREVKFRLLNRNKQAVLEALDKAAELDLPNTMLQAEIRRMADNARAELKARGLKDVDSAPLADDLFKPQAEKRVRLGLILSDLVKNNKLEATPEAIRKHIDEMAASYEEPDQVVRWYYADQNRLAEVEGIVVEANVTDFVLGQAKVVDKKVDFEELMGRN